MIVAKVELWPGGNAQEAKTLGIMVIRNVGQLEEPRVDPDLFAYEAEWQGAAFRKRLNLTHFRRHGVHQLLSLAFGAMRSQR